MPLRANALQRGSQGLALYRSLQWGNLARLHLLDGRQYRDLQACRPEGKASTGTVDPKECAALHDPGRSFLGWEQERWLGRQLQADADSASHAPQWSTLVQTTLFAARKHPSGKQSTDSWDGYPEARQRLVRQISESRPRNSVLLGGDIHQNYVCNIPALSDEAPGSATPWLPASSAAHPSARTVARARPRWTPLCKTARKSLMHAVMSVVTAWWKSRPAR